MAISELNDEQLVHKMLSAERELVAARFAHAQSTLENTASLRVLRKDIARLATEARRREIEGGLNKDSLMSKYRSTYSADGSQADQESGSGGGFLSGIVDKLTSDE